MSRQIHQKRSKGPNVTISPPSDADASSTPRYSSPFDYLFSFPPHLPPASSYLKLDSSPARRKRTRDDAGFPDGSPAPKRKHEERVPRPMNAFLIYRQWLNKALKEYREREGLPSEQQKFLSNRAGQSWTALTEEHKAPFERKAAEVKKEHKRLHPDYKFTPKAKGKNEAKPRSRKRPVSKAVPETMDTELYPEEAAYLKKLQEGVAADAMRVPVSPPTPIPPLMNMGADMSTSMGSAMDMRSFGMGTSGGQEQVSSYYRSNYASRLPNFAMGSGAGPSEPSGYYRPHCNDYSMPASVPSSASMQFLAATRWDSVASTPGLSPSSSPARSPARSPVPRSSSTGRSPARSSASSSSPARYHARSPASAPVPEMLSPEMHRIGRKTFKKIADEVHLHHVDNMYAQPRANGDPSMLQIDQSGMMPVGNGVIDPLQWDMGPYSSTEFTDQGWAEGLGNQVPTPEPTPVAPVHMPQEPASTKQPTVEELEDWWFNFDAPS